MNKINQDYPTVSENKKYNAKRMFAKRIIDNVTPESRYKTIQNNIYKTTPKPHPNTHSKIPKSKKQLELFDTGFKGFGVRSCHKIKKGSFIIEYVGEIIERHEYEQKMYKKRAKYIMDADNDMYIDAEKKGNESRFINHDCNPNSVSELRYIKGRPRICIIASRTINKKEEITISYGKEYSFEDGCKCMSCHIKSSNM